MGCDGRGHGHEAEIVSHVALATCISSGSGICQASATQCAEGCQAVGRQAQAPFVNQGKEDLAGEGAVGLAVTAAPSAAFICRGRLVYRELHRALPRQQEWFSFCVLPFMGWAVCRDFLLIPVQQAVSPD